ncbi:MULTISPECIES: rod shape-determining protein MreD [Nocardiopsis]|uniref:Rod shape-determining protein MreD n=1 Tax=Nocardiopsis sinuspersici TaxID=501010 RepID=A0A1V3C2J1_9ACTN|nr:MULTISPECIES: rod shape-determining protein MreD [Nocardiopsis]NYH51254.1 rod shape-determining protein MreD [Nocardiopsis sinuspersici]OOC55024.1 rod shape-determining protein MreD [Nocardiopsis sinuspersici]
MRTAAALIAVPAAVLVQTTIINRLPFDWGAGPDLVIAVVVAVALTTSPAAAAGCGFAAGLAMDVLPPAEHVLGRYALVLCLAAYVLALLRRNTGSAGSLDGRSSVWAVTGTVAATALGVGLGYAVVGLLMGDPRVSLAAVAVNTLVGTALTALVAPLVAFPLLRVRESLADDEYAAVRGPMPSGRW